MFNLALAILGDQSHEVVFCASGPPSIRDSSVGADYIRSSIIKATVIIGAPLMVAFVTSLSALSPTEEMANHFDQKEQSLQDS